MTTGGPFAGGGPIPRGTGIGLRFQHHEALLERRPAIAWLEAHTENYMGGGAALACLTTLRHDYPVSLHGVGLSLGSVDGIDRSHLARVRRVVERIEPGLVSEHLSWSTIDGVYLADLLPLPMTEEALDVMCANVDRVQTHLRRPILVENPSTYLQYRDGGMSESEFLAALVARTGCGLLLDVNNLYVSACNHGWDTASYLAGLPAHAIGEMHLAGHRRQHLDDGRVVRIDDHGSRVADEVWTLYGDAIVRFGTRPTLIEWDNDVPALDVLLDEATRAAAVLARAAIPDHARAA